MDEQLMRQPGRVLAHPSQTLPAFRSAKPGPAPCSRAMRALREMVAEPPCSIEVARPSFRVPRASGSGAPAPGFRDSETQKGVCGEGAQRSSPACTTKDTHYRVVARGWEPEGGCNPPSAIVPWKSETRGCGARRTQWRGGRRGREPASPTSRSVRPYRAPCGARPLPVAHDCVSKGIQSRCKRSLRSVPIVGAEARGGRAPRGARGGTKDRDGRRSGSAQGTGRGSGRKPARRRPPFRPKTRSVPRGRREVPSPPARLRADGPATPSLRVRLAPPSRRPSCPGSRRSCAYHP